jgi:CsoR family transcriptional regulator, copper-sensing transcriptional repressor
VRMTVCFMEQELGTRMGDKPAARADVAHMMENMESLLGKIR